MSRRRAFTLTSKSGVGLRGWGGYRVRASTNSIRGSGSSIRPTSIVRTTLPYGCSNQPHHMMQWESPWGRGYPGWHIECSAMSMKYLGATLDIHSGGLDHIPVHHENEIAQSESATGQPFVRYFVHNAFLVGMEGAKISKSAGRFPVMADLSEAGINPLAFRMLCLGAKYRSELAFSLDAVRGAERNLDYLYEFARNIREDAIAVGTAIMG